jgi:hypothetical protein
MIEGCHLLAEACLPCFRDVEARASKATEQFRQKMKTYTKTSDKGLGQDAATVEQTTWPQVLKAMDDSRVADDAKAKGWKGLFHKAGRHIGDAGGYINPWMDLLPDDMYTSIVCGGMKMVFNVRSQHQPIHHNQLSKRNPGCC